MARSIGVTCETVRIQTIMREDTQDSKSSSEQSQSRKDKLDKKRMIRKGITLPLAYEDVSSIDTSKLTRQEKAKVQKVKNRQAAQKSRDAHKIYVEGLEQQVSQLNQQLEARLCPKCRRALSDSVSDVTHTQPEENLFEQLIDSSTSSLHFSGTFQEDSLMERMEQQDHSSFFMNFLCITMILLAVYLCAPIPNSPSALITPRRDLMEIPQEASPKEEKSIPNSYELVPVSSKLDVLNDSECLKSLLRPIPQKTHLSKVGDLSEYREIKYQESLHDTIFCSHPKLYRDRPSANLLSRFIELVLNGAEILDIYGAKGLFPHQLVQLDGLYKVSAEVKKIERVTDHNCLV